MSCDWDVRCVTCGDNLGIYDANHEDKLMRFICANAEHFAKMGEAWKALKEAVSSTEIYWDPNFSLGRYSVHLPWFVEHRGHDLRPVDEYGRLDGQCWKWAKCGECGASPQCVLPLNHDGECESKNAGIRKQGENR